MNLNMVFKFQSIFAIFVFALIAGASEPGAQTPVVSGQVVTVDEFATCLKKNGNQKAPCEAYNPACESSRQAIIKAAAPLSRISPDKIDKYRNCLNDEETAGDDILSDPDADQEDMCQTIKDAGCSAIDDSNPKELLKDAEERDQKAQESVQAATKNAKEDQKNAERRMASIKQAMIDGERAYNLKIDEIQRSLDAVAKNEDQKLRDAASALRDQMTAKRESLSKLNDSVRDAEQRIAQAKTGWESSCRVEAVKKFEATKAEIKQLNDASKAKGEKYNYLGSSLAGASKRKEAKEKLKAQLDYVNGYKDCVAGVSESGARAKEALDNATSSLDSVKKAADERRVTLEKELTDLMSKYADAQTSSAENKDTLQKKAAADLAAATSAYKSSVEKANTAYTQAQQDLTDSMAQAEQANKLALTAANSSQKSLKSAQARASCSGNSSRTSTKVSRTTEQWQAVVKGDDERNLQCASAKEMCPSLTKLCTESTPKEDEKRGSSRGKSGLAK